ncbi:MAG TPA: carboxylating nicotinate-nucleotide diphosphorylase [Candidatus Polarisedimenticolia bacterium]|jgi:nicotinate-nucleotide pyrophosphorylase (carboxylating)
MPEPAVHLVARLVRESLQEDLGPGDVTCRALLAPGTRARGVITAGEPLIPAGLQAARLAFLTLDPACAFSRQCVEGAALPAGAVLLEVVGEASAILSAERTALNFLGRLSGIATLTRLCVDAVAGTKAEIFDTRKTTPGLRLLERRAVELGGGRNHRSGLFDMVLIKDNHVAMAGGVGAAVRAAVASLARTPPAARPPIEVEIDDPAALEEAIEAGAGLVLLDNMTPDEVAAAVLRARGRVKLEASGGITLEVIRRYAETGVDRISLGALTHSAPGANVGLSLHPAPIDPGAS